MFRKGLRVSLPRGRARDQQLHTGGRGREALVQHQGTLCVRPAELDLTSSPRSRMFSSLLA